MSRNDRRARKTDCNDAGSMKRYLARMQTPSARKATIDAFNATPAEMGAAAVRAARKNRQPVE
ncbi:MAG: hypothetical protein EHM16_13770 [Betaproteobacteria bacterium]|nr:MAG: hypothetical protein EHM16_13770 [Betaproteobacteria bacterium]